ncbi:MAG: MlaC/ttg2D family ABC transporter substrate-binding protein [Mucilaginibacter sp.]
MLILRKLSLFLMFSYFSLFVFVADGCASDLIDPQKIIEESSNQIKVRMQDGEFTKDFLKVTEFIGAVINPHADFDLISSLVLGKFWRQAAPAEQESFKKEFQTLLIRSYSRGFVEFKNWTINYFPVKVEDNEHKVLIKTQILQPALQPVAVDYRMILINDEWKVYDIMIEGISLVATFRSSFKNDIERTGSLKGIIDHLAQRNAEALGSENHS